MKQSEIRQFNTDNGYYALVGRVINQAIFDYKNLRFRSEGLTLSVRKHLYHDAKSFLFTDRLEDFIHKFNLGEMVNADYIRNSVA